MAFDEQFHFGIIKLYAQHISPFWNGQPDGADQFGAIARDPSYLYQYALSFPYRLISMLSSSEATQVICLRLLNVTLLAGAVVVFRRILKQLGASPTMRNVVMAFFILTPVVPLLGAQINYDNVVVLMTALAFTTFLCLREASRVNNVWNWSLVIRLAIICMFASLVKYAFLPLAAGLFVAVVFELRYTARQGNDIYPNIHIVKISKVAILYTILMVVGLGLFSERYLVNIAKYHTPIPECNQVLSIAQCQGYAPWARNYTFASYDIQLKTQQIATYPFLWMSRALGETVFSITSRFSANGTVDYYTTTQLPVPTVLSWSMFAGGGALALLNWRFIRRYTAFVVLLGIAGLYILVLFAQNLLDYIHLGLPVAIHGRYLLPVLPLLYLAVAYGLKSTIEALSGTTAVAFKRKTVLAASLLIVFAIEGGGFVSPIINSHDDWFWPQSRPAQVANQYVRDVLQYVVIR